MTSLERIHPLTLGVYFVSVIGVTMFTNNPLLLLLALSGSLTYAGVIRKRHEFVRNLVFYGIMFVLISLSNPLLSHNGATPLFFINGNPITLEAFFYGMDIAVMLIGVISWFNIFNKTMTSDKLLFLFGNISPKISLIMALALRFVPHFKKQSIKINQAQRCMGLYATDSWADRLRGVIRNFSALVTWSFENAIDTGVSMKSRGYGLKGRTSFGMYKFNVTDGGLLCGIVLTDVILLIVMALGKLDWVFYPKISVMKAGIAELFVYAVWAVLVWLPVIIEVKERLQWKYYRSKI